MRKRWSYKSLKTSKVWTCIRSTRRRDMPPSSNFNPTRTPLKALNFLGDVTSDFILQGQDILQLFLVAPRPQMAVGLRVDQLSGDAHVVLRTRDRALNDRLDVQFAADLR